jgi:class 3 adenylate cyclase/predicted ATPase
MSDIGAWLKKLNLAQYRANFADNEIDWRALRELSDQDLKDIGVSPLGHRRILLAAIKTLGEDAQDLPRPDAERRQITIMFCDLVGSTTLAEQLDPEELRTLMHGYQRACAHVVDSYGGHVAQFLGDGVMVYFGWPRAHEDDAERAVRAALDIVEAVKTVEAREPQRVRIGIATGHVVVGDGGGADSSLPQVAVGDTPNLASRLQGVAEPDQIIVAPATKRLIGEAFELSDLGPLTLKGIVEPVRAWRATGLAQTAGRFEAAHGARLTPMVGRDAEIAMILERWKRATKGEGQVVLLSGEAGIGKSRVVQVVREYVSLESHINARFQCSPFHANSALYPVIEHFESVSGFESGDSPDMKRDKLDAVLTKDSPAASYLTPLLARMLSIDPTETDSQPDLSPQMLKESTLEALTGQALGLADSRPVLMVLEDAHWIDPTSQDLFNRLVAAMANAKILLLVTFRPEYRPPWIGHGHVLPMTLTRLGKSQATDMVEKLASSVTLPRALLDKILAQTDGVPLYVEELTKSVMESGLPDKSARSGGGNSDLAIPATLQDSLTARLDRLGPAKEVAQISSCIGRWFSLDVLESVAGADLASDDLSDSLAVLESSGLIVRGGRSKERLYGFKHALVQEAAYNSLLNQRRLSLHQRIGDILRKRFDGSGDGKPEDIAYHLTQCGDLEGALRMWRVAGERSSARSAHNEAIVQYRNALEALERIDGDIDRPSRELELLLLLGPSLMSIKGWADPEVRGVYVQASTLARQVGSTDEVFTATWGQWLVNQQFGQIDYAAELSRQVLALAEPLHESGYLLQAHHAAWTTRFRLAEFEACRTHADQGIALYSAREHGGHAQIYGGHDPGVCARFHGGMSLWMLGFPAQAEERVRDAVALAGDLAHPFSRAHAGFHAAQLYELLGDADASLFHAEEISRIAEENDFAFIGVVGQAMRARALAEKGRADEAVPLIQESIRRLRDSQVGARLSYFLSLLVASLVRTGDMDAARGAVDQAMASLNEHGEMTWVAEVYRLKGCVLHRLGAENDPEAEIWLQRALDLAREQGARSWELRTATDLARLKQARQDIDQARDLLTTTYGGFTEGFETKDLRDAKALLDELAV